MKKILLFIVAFLSTVSIAHAISVLNSSQVGTSPVAGSVLQTNGSISTWVATSTLGISGGVTSFNTQTGAATYGVTCTSGCSVVSSTNSAAITVTGGGANAATGTIYAGAAFTGTNTLGSTTVLNVPQNFAGCGTGDFGSCVNFLYNSVSSTATNVGIVIPSINVLSASWTTPIFFGNNSEIPNLICPGGAKLHYGGTGNAVNFTFNVAQPHDRSEDYGCSYYGHSSVIAAGDTNTATTTGILFGGTVGNNSANGIDFHDNTVNGFGMNIQTATNTYMLNFTANAVSGGNGSLAGSLVHINTSANSGERMVFDGNSFTDPGNSTTTNSIYLADGGIESFFFSNNSVDDGQLYVGSSNAQVSITNNNFEYSAPGTYPAYIAIVNPSSDRSTQLTITGNEFAADGTPVFTGLVKHGGQLTFVGNHINLYGGGTVDYMVDHSNDNGVASDYVCQNQLQGGTVTNIINGSGGITYSLTNGATCWYNVGNSYSIALMAQSNNTNNFMSGGVTEGTYDHNGNWTITTGLTAGSSTAGPYQLNAVGTAAASGFVGFQSLDNGFQTNSRVVIGSTRSSDGTFIEPGIWMGSNAASPDPTNYVLNLDANAAGGSVLNAPSSNNLSLRMNNTSYLHIDGTSHNVGINTGDANASTTLEVGGDITDQGVLSAPFLGTTAAGKIQLVSTSTLKGYTDTFGYSTSTSSASVTTTAFSTSTTFGSASNTNVATVTLPSATTSTWYDIFFDISNNTGGFTETSTIKLGGTQIAQCSTNGGVGSVVSGEIRITMMNSTSSELINMWRGNGFTGAGTVPCSTLVNTLTKQSIDMSSSPLITVQIQPSGSTSHTDTTISQIIVGHN